MSAGTDLVWRSGDLKRALVDFGRQRRFAVPFRRALRQHFGQTRALDKSGSQFINFLDYFILQHRLPDGLTVVEHFVQEHPELSEQESSMLLGWRDVVEGIFEVGRRKGPVLVVVNLVDELTYHVRSNMGPAVFAPMRPRSFLITRLIPVGDQWLLSGVSSLQPAANRTQVYRAAAELASRRPALAFRNPQKLERAWELQREDRRHFMTFFGSDLVVLAGSELEERMRAYGHFRQHEVRDAAGKSAADRAQAEYGVAPAALDFKLPPELSEAPSVGLIYDEVEGLNFFPDFGLLQEAFANPALVADREHRQEVIEYLESPGISPLPLRRLAERDPERASRVFQRVLKQPDFSWQRDGEALLRRHKASFFEQPVLPSITPISPALARSQLAASAVDEARPHPRPSKRRSSKRPGRK